MSTVEPPAPADVTPADPAPKPPRRFSPREILHRLSDRPAMSNAQREHQEMRWGIAAAVVLAIICLVAAGLYVFTPGQGRLVAHFDEAGQIKVGDNVRVAGVPVGSVKKITLDGDHVSVEMSVGRDVFIGEESRADAKMLTVVGGNFIDITSAGKSPLGDKPISKDNTSVPYSLTKTFSLAQPKIEAIDVEPLRNMLVQVQEGMAANPGALKQNLKTLQSMLANLNNRQDEFGTMLSLAAEYTKGINVNGDILTALGRNLATFVSETETYGVRLAYVFKRLGDLLERLKGVVLQYDTTIDPLVRRVDAIGRQFGPLLQRYEPMIKQGRDLIKRLEGMVGPDGSIQIDHSNLVLSTDYCMPMPGVRC